MKSFCLALLMLGCLGCGKTKTVPTVTLPVATAKPNLPEVYMQEWAAECIAKNIGCYVERDLDGRWYAAANKNTGNFMHWGAFAQSKEAAVAETRRLMEAPNPDQVVERINVTP